MVWAMTGAFVVFLLIGVPVAFAMSVSAVLALLVFSNVPLVLLPQLLYTSIDNFTLLAIPLFVFAGELMNAGGLTERIVRLSRSLVGHFRGGLAMANVTTNTFMAAISGSAAADVAAVGSMMIPAMTRAGYQPRFSVAVTSCAAMLAPIIPPSIIAVIYASLTGVSIGKLFLAGVVPGLLAAIGMMILTRHLAGTYGSTPDKRSNASERLAALWHGVPALVMPGVIVGGILGGIVTATEAGAVAVAYALFYGAANRKLSLRDLYRMIVSASVVTSSTLVVLGGAALFSWVLVRNGVAVEAIRWLKGLSDDPNVILLLVLGFLFILGLALEPVPALILSVPILNPIVQTMGFDPLSFGVAAIMTLVLGSVTPPVGVLAMIACRIAGIRYSSTFGVLVPYTVLWASVSIITAFVPFLANWLPSLLD